MQYRNLARLAVVAFVSISLAPAANIVANPGFEAGDFSSWTLVSVQDPVCNLVTAGAPYAFQGDFGARLGDGGDVADRHATLSQTLTVASGQPYLLSFFFGSFNLNGSAEPWSYFEVFWNNASLGAPGGSTSNVAFFPYTLFLTPLPAVNATSATLEFRFWNVFEDFALDSLCVTQVGDACVEDPPEDTPEPATWATLAFGAAALGLRRGYRRLLSANGPTRS